MKKFDRFYECMVIASSELLNEEGFYKAPYDKMEIHQKIKCKVQAERAMRMLKKALIKLRGGKEHG